MSVEIEVRRASKSFGAVAALDAISLDIDAGEVLTVLGPSGCGKTTLLRMIAGLVAPTSGTVRIDGVDTAEARRRKQIGFVPQSPGLLPWRTVEANARLLLDINRRANANIALTAAGGAAGSHGDTVTVERLLDDVGLTEFRDAYPHELSGGMQQRVALVRAMALSAPVLLMDEPFAALDELTRTEMRHLLGRIARPLGTTIVFVTHSISEAAFLGDRVAVMSPRPGRIASIVPVDFARPRHPDLEDDARFFRLTTELRHQLLSAGESSTEATT